MRIWIIFLSTCLVSTIRAEKVKITSLPFDDVDAHAQDDEGRRFKRDVPMVSSMPDHLIFRLESTVGTAMLRLTKIPQLPVISIRGGKSENVSEESMNQAAYRDISREGVFRIKRVIREGEIIYQLIGQFLMGTRVMNLNPVGRAVNPHNLTEDNIVMDLTEDNLVMDLTEDNLVMDFGNDGYEIPVSTVDNLVEGDNSQRALDNLIVELCMVADVAIYKKFLLDNNNDVAATRTEMSIYYAFMAEQMRVRYLHVNQVDTAISISIIVSGLVIFEDPADVAFIESLNIGGVVDSLLGLEGFTAFINKPPASISFPQSDHYMLFTGYDLARKGSLHSLGLAYIGTVCGIKATSFIEDNRVMQSAFAATHELGHGLGSQHDSVSGCYDTDQYIMASSTVIINSAEVAARSWQFSSCSVNQFKTTLANKICLDDNNYDGGQLTSSPKLGQIYSIDDQCKFLIGPNSSHNTDRVTTPEERCYKEFCYLNATHHRYIQPTDYSDCDTDKWCIQGQCVQRVGVNGISIEPGVWVEGNSGSIICTNPIVVRIYKDNIAVTSCPTSAAIPCSSATPDYATVTVDVSTNTVNFTIANISRTRDSGVWKCNGDPNTTTIDVKVGVSSVSINNRNSLIFTDQQITSVTCQTGVSNPYASITWSIGGNKPAIGTTTNNIDGTTTSILQHTAAKTGHNTILQCSATNGYGTTKTDSIIINIRYLDPVTISSNRLEVSEDEGVYITCSTNSNPVASITWHNGRRTIKTTQSNTDTLNIVRATCLDTAVYSCYVTNTDIPDRRFNQSASLFVRCSPRPDTRVDSQYTVSGSLDDTVQLVADVIAYPAPSFTWYYTNNNTGGLIPISTDGSYQQSDINTSINSFRSTLNIHISSSIFYRSYTFNVTNDGGSNNLIFDVKAQAPEPPSNIGVIIGVVVSVLLVVCILVVIIIIKRKQQRDKIHAGLDLTPRQTDQASTYQGLQNPRGPEVSDVSYENQQALGNTDVTYITSQGSDVTYVNHKEPEVGVNLKREG